RPFTGGGGRTSGSRRQDSRRRWVCLAGRPRWPRPFAGRRKGYRPGRALVVGWTSPGAGCRGMPGQPASLAARRRSPATRPLDNARRCLGGCLPWPGGGRYALARDDAAEDRPTPGRFTPWVVGSGHFLAGLVLGVSGVLDRRAGGTAQGGP